MPIPDHVIDEIRDRADIVEVIGEVVELKKRGRNFVGLCPFHAEKTPSFTVTPEKQMYYCFGCQAGGNVFTFLMQHERLEFPDAARLLGERTGVEVPEPEAAAGPDPHAPLHVANRLAGDISQEERKRVAFALALSTDPTLVLLDEPAGGVNPEETAGLADLIRKFVRHGITVCLIEHKMDMIMSLADKIMVLNYGEKIAEGTPAEIRSNPAVIDAYLGSEHADA